MSNSSLIAIVCVVCPLACSDVEPGPSTGAAVEPPTAHFAETWEMAEEQTDESWAALPFERLSLERTGCFGTCPVYRVQLFRGGRAHFEGGEFAPREGSFEGRMSYYGYGLLCSLAERTALLDLRDHYSASWTCDETILFEFDGPEGAKKISDYGRQGPAELMAYRALFDELAEQVDWQPARESR